MNITYTLHDPDWDTLDGTITQIAEHTHNARRLGEHQCIKLELGNGYLVDTTVCYDTEHIHLEDNDTNYCVRVFVYKCGNTVPLADKTIVEFNADERADFEDFLYSISTAADDFQVGLEAGLYVKA